MKSAPFVDLVLLVFPCLRSFAYAWIKVLEASFKNFDENKEFYEDKISTAKFYFEKVLPRSEQHYKTAISGSSNIMKFKFN